MSFLNKILPKKDIEEYFLTVGVEENRITATVSLISGSEVTVIGSGASEFADTTEETEAADIAISEAEKKIGKDILVQKVIFGLPLSLLEGDKIKPLHLNRLKKITKALSLIPCGFIEYPQALAYYLETKEESPPTLLLLSVGKNQVTFSHIRVGKIEKNVIVDKTSSFTSDFSKALGDFSTAEILPSKIMLYNESGEAKLEEIQEELLQYPWHKHSTFLHTPKIEILEASALSFALVEGAARSLARELHLEENTESNVDTEPDVNTETAVGEESTINLKTVRIQEDKLSREEDFGFVKDKDIAAEVKESESKSQNIREESKVDRVMMQTEIATEEEKRPAFPKLPKFNFSLPKLSFISFPMIAIGIIVILVLASFGFIYWSVPKATVNLIIYPASTSSHVDVLFTTNPDSVKSAKNTILATSVSAEAAQDKTTTTTGQTKIGEKATGSVTIYNKTLAGKTFPKGTVLVTDNLKFTLDDDATIASASDTGEGLTFGKNIAKITAYDIGPDGNLAVGTNFTFKDFDKPSYYAKNSEKLSGGTSRDITSVSKDDQDKLLTSLTQDLTSQAKQQMMQKLKDGEKLLDVSVESNISSKKFNKNVGEEAKELTLSLILKVSSLIYKQQDLTNLTHDSLSQAPSGYTIAQDKTSIKVVEAKINKNGDVVGKAVITYYFLPQVDSDKIKSAISGKTFTQADKYLSTVQNIGGLEIISDTKLPFISNRLPLRSENINITLVPR